VAGLPSKPTPKVTSGCTQYIYGIGYINSVSICISLALLATGVGRTLRIIIRATNSCYAALLPRRGPHIASHSVCPSVCPSVPLSIPSVTSRHLANYNDTHVLFGTRRGPHIVRPSRPHKFLF